MLPMAARAFGMRERSTSLCWRRAETVIAAVDSGALRTALEAAERGTSGFWDGLLLATVARAGCDVLLSENMQDGTRFGGVTILNPFVGDELPECVAALLR